MSLPGEFVVARESPTTPLMVYPLESMDPATTIENQLEVIYDCGPIKSKHVDNFETIRNRIQSQWTALPKHADPISLALKEKITSCKEAQIQRNTKTYNNGHNC